MWFKSLSNTKQSLLVGLSVLVLILVAIYFRLDFISNHNFVFYFDQARDAFTVREIWLDHNLKIQGPTASGTHDTVFHGVFYYYFLAPWYFLSQGDPQLPTTALMIWCVVIGLPAVYFLAVAVSKSKRVGLLTTALVAISAQHIGYSVFLTNPTLGYPFLPIFFLAVWKLFFEESLQKRYIFLLGLSLGILIQSVLWFIPLFLIVLGGLYYLYSHSVSHLKKLISIRNILLFGVPLMVCLLPMVFVQTRMYLLGIFTFSGLKQATMAHQVSDFSSLVTYLDFYLRKLTETFFPAHSLYLLLLLPFFYFGRHVLNKKQKVFGFLLLCIPLAIGLIQPRSNSHFFLGLEITLYLYLSIILVRLSFPLKWLVVSGLLILIFFSNQKQLTVLSDNHAAIFEFPLAKSYKTTLQDSLNLVDETYRRAQGKPFSISAFTNPFRYNTILTYLYDWYGREKYGYVPSYYGDTQAGLINQGILPEVEKTLAIHFSVIMSNNDMGQNYLDDFKSVQARAAGVPQEFAFFGKHILYPHPTETVSDTLTTP